MPELFYCVVCGNVVAFDLHQIKKHGMNEVGDRRCMLCDAYGYLPLKEEHAREGAD